MTCHLGRWVSKEDVSISEQTSRVVLYYPEGQIGNNFVSWSCLFLVTFPYERLQYLKTRQVTAVFSPLSMGPCIVIQMFDYFTGVIA